MSDVFIGEQRRHRDINCMFAKSFNTCCTTKFKIFLISIQRLFVTLFPMQEVKCKVCLRICVIKATAQYMGCIEQSIWYEYKCYDVRICLLVLQCSFRFNSFGSCAKVLARCLFMRLESLVRESENIWLKSLDKI